MDPRELQRRLIPEVKECVLIVASGYAISEIGDEFDQLSQYLQALAITYLLVQGDQQEFRNNLIRSGHARRYYLRRCREESVTNDRHLALSRTDAMLSCLASGDLALARELSDLSLQNWNSEWEYEDDFYFLHFLGRGLDQRNVTLDIKLSEVLDKLIGAVGDGNSTEVQICKSLVARNTDEFTSALHDMMSAKQIAYDETVNEIVTMEFPDSLYWLRRSVSIKGLAILQLAKLFSMEIVPFIPLCPDIGRLPIQQPNLPDMFEAVDRERRLITNGP